MRLSNFSFVLALLSSAVIVQGQVDLHQGSSLFTIFQGDKSVGSSETTITSTAAGYNVASHGDLKLSKFSYSFDNKQSLDHALNLVNDQITGAVNGSPVTFSVNSDPTGREFHIEVSAQGKNTHNTIDRHQHLALLADLDSAGYMLLTRIGLENPRVSWVLIPKQDGLLVPSVYSQDASVRGQIDGKDVDVQHTTVTVSGENAVTVELFHTPDGRLLEADLPEQNFYVVRDGFKLIDRPTFAPPRSPEGSEAPLQQSEPPQYSAPQSAPQPQQQ